MTDSSQGAAGPRPIFSAFNAVAVLVGIVVGIGIFRLPPLVAANAAGGWEFIGFWVAGGAVTLVGALCYAELAAAYPDAGGEYHFLSKAYGPSLGFLFSWGRMTVIQTGSIALAGFILGDYATRILDLGRYSAEIYAAVTVIGLTGLNLWGTNPSRLTQNVVTSVIVVLLLAAAVLGLWQPVGGSAAVSDPGSGPAGSLGGAMIFVLLTYGGWNEVSYLSGELIDVKRNMIRVLVSGIALITVIYVAVNYAYLRVLGMEGLRESEAVGADLMEAIMGPDGALILSAVVVIAALSTANATIITGARTNYALGRDFSLLRGLGTWDGERNSPVYALLVQGGIALLLVALGSVTEDSVATMVDYTAPVFWLFLMLTGLSLFIFRRRNGASELPYRVPLYPLTPILFILMTVFMLYSSLAYTGFGAMVGVGILLAGVPLLMWSRSR